MIRNIKTKLTKQSTQIFTTVFRNETSRESKFKKQAGKMSEKLYDDVRVSPRKGGSSDVEYFVGGDRGNTKNWKLILRINSSGKVSKNGAAKKAYTEFLERYQTQQKRLLATL